MSDSKWAADDIPDQSGRTFVVTGGNSGIGFEAAKGLARKGAQVIIACRNTGKAQAAIREIEKTLPGTSVVAEELDLASLASTKAFAERFKAKHEALHGLCNNAGVMALPERRTADGFEMQFGTNHLGHFALTAHLLDLILATPNARIVTVSSTAHLPGRMRWDDLQWKSDYRKWRAYSQSKLANLLFAFELKRRLAKKGASVRSLACHPGYAATNLQRGGPRMAGSGLMERVADFGNAVLAQDAAMGALPTLFAMTAPEAQSGDYIGPSRFNTWGHPTQATASKRAQDPDDAARLWSVSEALTGVEFPLGV